MKYTKTLVVLAMLAATSAISLLTISTADSFAQNNTYGAGNQSGSSAVNDTATSNQTGSGNISGLMNRL